MSTTRTALAQLLAQTLDQAAAVAASAWPRSAAGREARRLVDDGYAPGQPCEIAFSVSFSDALDVRATLAAARSGGVAVADLTSATRGFVTVTVPARVRAYDLSLASRRMDRLARACGGFAAEIGPVTAPQRRAPALTLHATGDAAA